MCQLTQYLCLYIPGRYTICVSTQLAGTLSVSLHTWQQELAGRYTTCAWCGQVHSYWSIVIDTDSLRCLQSRYSYVLSFTKPVQSLCCNSHPNIPHFATMSAFGKIDEWQLRGLALTVWGMPGKVLWSQWHCGCQPYACDPPLAL